MSRYKAWRIVAGVMIASAASAQTAQQTPENAHRFLVQLAAQGQIRFEPADNYDEFTFHSSQGRDGQYWIQDRSSTHEALPLPFAIASDSKCLTKPVAFPLYGKDYEQEPSRTGPKGMTIPGTETARRYLPHLRAMNASGIDWSRVKSSEANGDAVIVSGAGLSGGYIKLRFDSPDMAARAAFAIEVIRQSCDPAAGTGF